MDARRLHTLVTRVAPVAGVRIGDPDDRATWELDFEATATPEQRAAAQAVVDNTDPQTVIADDVEAEAQRRILARYPDWKQRNMTARGVELTFKVAQGEALAAGETDEIAALQAAWGWIKAVRAASDTLEALDPIPADFAEDARWPA